MSWIFGAVGDLSDAHIARFQSIHPLPLHSLHSKELYISAGGLEETCLYKSTEEHTGEQPDGWVVCGLGIIKKKHNNFSIANKDDWKQILFTDSPDLKAVEGHYIVVKWSKEKVICFNDQLGLRTIYITELPDLSVFTTRLDWLVQLRDDCEIDFKEFSAHWLLAANISDKSILTNTFKLGPSGRVVINPGAISLHHKKWEADFCKPSDYDSIIPNLKTVINLPFREGNSVSLSFSGGLDSRVLLSCLLQGSNDRWDLHTFGNPDHPDARIAKTIAEDFGAPHTIYNEPIPSNMKILSDLKEYIGHSQVVSPISFFFKYIRYYPLLNKPGNVVIDGGFGEIARCQSFRKLQLFGKNGLLSGDLKTIKKYLYFYRASFFSNEVMQLMERFLGEQLQSFMDSMPPVNEAGIEDWLTLMIVRANCPNMYGPDQSYIDTKMVNFMPFAQPSFVKGIFQIPVSNREDAKLFKRIIQENYKRLMRYPLVKGGVYYPPKLGTLSSLVFRKLKERLGFEHQDQFALQYLRKFSEFVNDTLHSRGVKDSGLYDFPRISFMLNEFYAGNKDKYAEEIDWWLTFEVWRQLVYGE